MKAKLSREHQGIWSLEEACGDNGGADEGHSPI